MKLIYAVALLLLLALPIHAEVLVFKGTIKVVASAPPTVNFPAVVSVYFLIDPAAGQYASVGYYSKVGKHQYHNDPVTAYFSSAAAAAGKTLTGVCSGSTTIDDSTHFYFQTFLITGLNSTLTTQTTSSIQTRNFPKTLAGVEPSVLNNAAVGNISQGQLVLAFQAKATVDANNAGKSITDVESDLESALSLKGYQQ